MIRRGIALAVLVGLLALPAFAQKHPKATGTIFVSSQGLYYDTFVVKDPLPMHGKFQLLVNGVTQFGPGDPGYLGGRWWEDLNQNGMQDEGDHFSARCCRRDGLILRLDHDPGHVPSLGDEAGGHGRGRGFVKAPRDAERSRNRVSIASPPFTGWCPGPCRIMIVTMRPNQFHHDGLDSHGRHITSSGVDMVAVSAAGVDCAARQFPSFAGKLIDYFQALNSGDYARWEQAFDDTWHPEGIVDGRSVAALRDQHRRRLVAGRIRAVHVVRDIDGYGVEFTTESGWKRDGPFVATFRDGRIYRLL